MSFLRKYCLRGSVFRHCEKNYKVIRRSDLRSLLLLHEIATLPTVARNDDLVSTQ
ncbi:hypothetical protein [Rickettsia felis]|uniref:hypothetical protein n=1 Tax=Rickettsia felis TaxID=42862 RepID=UPI000AF76D02|nr:hypothetical protein [Rickettsia felis]